MPLEGVLRQFLVPNLAYVGDANVIPPNAAINVMASRNFLSRDRQHRGIGRMGVDNAANVGPRFHDVEMNTPFRGWLERPGPRSILPIKGHRCDHVGVSASYASRM